MSSLLEVKDLRVSYGPARAFGRAVEILHGVSLHVAKGETLGLVGESGSGKTTIGRAVLGLVPSSGGSVNFDGQDITNLKGSLRRKIARDIQVVFQDPYGSLNPSLIIGDILAEPLIAQGASPKDARSRIASLLDQVGLPKDSVGRLPREFSGGQRQRIAIARALAPEPKLIVCDEPVSALDLSTQSRVLDLLVEIQQATGVSYLFVSHDLAVVRAVSHRVAVIYRGDIVETGSASQVTSEPWHAYTRQLLLAAPVAHPARQEQRRADRARLREQIRQEDEQAGAI